MTEKKKPMKSTIAQQKYDDAHCVRINVKFNTTTDAPILAKLAKVPSMAGYIKFLIMQDVKENDPALLEITQFDRKQKTQSMGRVPPTIEQLKASKYQKKGLKKNEENV